MANPAECPQCHHSPLFHEPDGSGATCIVCVWLATQETDKAKRDAYPVCVRKYEFRLSKRDREQALLAPKDSWQPRACCLNCGYEWQQHHGYLCPTGDDTFIPYIEGHLDPKPTIN